MRPKRPGNATEDAALGGPAVLSAAESGLVLGLRVWQEDAGCIGRSIGILQIPTTIMTLTSVIIIVRIMTFILIVDTVKNITVINTNTNSCSTRDSESADI